MLIVVKKVVLSLQSFHTVVVCIFTSVVVCTFSIYSVVAGLQGIVLVGQV